LFKSAALAVVGAIPQATASNAEMLIAIKACLDIIAISFSFQFNLLRIASRALDCASEMRLPPNDITIAARLFVAPDRLGTRKFNVFCSESVRCAPFSSRHRNQALRANGDADATGHRSAAAIGPHCALAVFDI